MASIRKRGTSWQVQIRREGYPPKTRTFSSKADALAWARHVDTAVDRGDFSVMVRDLKGLTVGDLIRRYLETVTPNKRSASTERYRLQAILVHDLARVALIKLLPAALVT